MTQGSRKHLALEFLRRARAGERRSLDALFTATACHHNAHFPAGMSALLDGIADAAKDGPARPVDVKRVVEEGDTVVVHSHVRENDEDPGFSAIHMFRFEDHLIAEFWDLAAPVPTAPVNRDGMF